MGAISPIFNKHFRNLKHEDIGFKGAMLARIRQTSLNHYREKKLWLDRDSIQKAKEEIYEELHSLEVEEHWEIMKADLIEQTYCNSVKSGPTILVNLRNMQKNIKNREYVINLRTERLSSAQNIIDPNMFPIFSLQEQFDTLTYFGLWQTDNEIKEKIFKSMKFWLEIRLSSLEHHEAGNGVFLRTEEEFIPEGTLLGFIPGVIHPNYDISPSELETKEERKFIHRYDLTMIDFSAKIPYPYRHGINAEDYAEIFDKYSNLHNTNEASIMVSGENFNPYAVGHKINHPPPQALPNVIVLDLIIPRSFFTADFLKFFPYIISDNRIASDQEKGYFNSDCYHGLAIVALRDIKHGEELFMDYHDLNLYFGKEKYPDWLVDPPELDPLLSKRYYENKITPFGLFFNKNLKTFFLKQGKRTFATLDQVPSFKGRSRLNEFYKLTHPDMLSNAPPNVKEENLRSIKIINSYLDSLSMNQGVTQEKIRMFIADKTNRKSRKFTPFEINLPTIRPGIEDNILSNQLERTIQTILTEMRKVKGKEPKIEGDEGNESADIGGDAPNFANTYQYEMGPLSKRKDILESMDSASVINMYIKEKRMQKTQNSINRFLNEELYTLDYIGKKPKSWGYTLLADHFEKYRSSSLLSIDLLYFDEKLTQGQIDKFLVNNSSDSKAYTTKTATIFENVNELCRINRVMIHVSTAYMPSSIPGFVSIPFDFKIDELYKFVEEHAEDIHLKKIDFEKDYSNCEKALSVLKTELSVYSIDCKLIYGPNHGRVLREVLLVKKYFETLFENQNTQKWIKGRLQNLQLVLSNKFSLKEKKLELMLGCGYDEFMSGLLKVLEAR